MCRLSPIERDMTTAQFEALGNGFDRIVHGTVTDFINFHFWPVFNVADSAISIGVVLLIAGYLIRKPSA